MSFLDILATFFSCIFFQKDQEQDKDQDYDQPT